MFISYCLYAFIEFYHEALRKDAIACDICLILTCIKFIK